VRITRCRRVFDCTLTMHFCRHCGIRTSCFSDRIHSTSTNTPPVMVAENISLGVLALPQAVAWLGLVPGLLLVFVLGIIAGYTGFIIGQFKQKYPQVTQFSDVGEIIAGTWGRRVMATGQLLILIFIQAAHVLSFAIAMNVLVSLRDINGLALGGLQYANIG
jgi:hypothetical protein